jgi:hypothetical protein
MWVEIPDRFAHEALASVALVRFADLLAGDDGIAVGDWVVGMGEDANDNRALGKCLAPGPSIADLPVIAKAEGAIHKVGQWAKGKGQQLTTYRSYYCLLPIATCLFILREFLLVADGQLRAALGATALQDQTTALGGHTLEEAVLAQARNALGLVGSLGHVFRAPVARMPERSSSRTGIERRWSQKRAAAIAQRQRKS